MKIATLLKSLFFPSKLIFPSKYHKNVRIGYSYGHLTLFTGDVSQSGGEYVYMWNKALDYIDKYNSKISNCLMLGVGGGTVAKVVKSKYPSCKIKGVEIDPQMVVAAKKFFGIKKIRDFKLIVDDACKWVKICKEKFDLIIIDLFINDLNPSCSRSKEFLTGVKKILSKAGYVLYNSHFQKDTPQDFEKFKSLCQKIFGRAIEIHEFPKNRVLFM